MVNWNWVEGPMLHTSELQASSWAVSWVLLSYASWKDSANMEKSLTNSSPDRFILDKPSVGWQVMLKVFPVNLHYEDHTFPLLVDSSERTIMLSTVVWASWVYLKTFYCGWWEMKFRCLMVHPYPFISLPSVNPRPVIRLTMPLLQIILTYCISLNL